MVPEGWERVKLGQISKIYSGGTPSRANPEYYGGNIPWVKSGEVNSPIIRGTEESITEKAVNESSAKWVEAGTTLIAMYGATAGKVSKLAVRATINQAISAVRADTQKVLDPYLYYVLQHNSPNILRKVQGSGQPNLSGNLIKTSEILLPPLPEQKKIAAILGSVDEAIQATQAVIDQTRKVKQGLLQQLLTHGIGHTRFKQTAIGEIPEGWEVRQLQDVAKVQTGLAKGKKNIEDPVELPYLRVANVQDGYIDLIDIKKITVARKDVDRYRLQYGDVLLTEGGDFDKLGRGDMWRAQVEPCLHQNHVFAVRVDPALLLPEFFAIQAGSGYGKRYFLSCAKQTTNLASINSSQLKGFPALLPPLDEQKAIVDIISSADDQIAADQKILANLEKQKRGLMQDLLTGRVRCNVT